jgi:hypothetical protein
MRPPEEATARSRKLNARLAEALRRAFGVRAPLPDDATTDMRLRHLESEVAEVSSRVNALFFAVLGSLALELVGKAAL